MELTERYRRWKAEGGDTDSMEDKTEYDGEGGRLGGGDSLAPNTLLRNLPPNGAKLYLHTYHC